MHEYDHLLTTVGEYLYCNILCPLPLNMTSSDHFFLKKKLYKIIIYLLLVSLEPWHKCKKVNFFSFKESYLISSLFFFFTQFSTSVTCFHSGVQSVGLCLCDLSQSRASVGNTFFPKSCFNLTTLW